MLKNFRIWFYRRLALNSMTAGKTEKAEKWYRRLEKIEPGSLEVLHNLAVIYIGLKRYRESESYLAREIEIFGESDIRLRILGDLYYGEGNMEKAGKAYGRALAMFQKGGGDKNTEKFLKKRIKNCGEKKLFAKAMEGARLFEEGSSRLKEGRHSEALDCFRRAAENDSSSYMALNAAGTILLNSEKDYNSARIYFMKALELADIPLVKNNLAIAECRMKEGGAI